MLGKLLKYEFKATTRQFIPLYLTLLVFSIINHVFISWSNTSISTWSFYNVLMLISAFAYMALMAALSIMTLFVMIQRFYKNLLGDEGYLMFTLPVQSWKQILSKLMISMFWTVASSIVATCSLMFVFSEFIFTKMFFSEFSMFFMEFNQFFGAFGYLAIFEMMMLVLFSLAGAILTIYAAIALGHLFSKYKLLASFGMYTVLGMVLQILLVVLIFIGDRTGIINQLSLLPSPSRINVALLFPILFASIVTAGSFALTNYILTRKLNLE